MPSIRWSSRSMGRAPGQGDIFNVTWRAQVKQGRAGGACAHESHDQYKSNTLIITAVASWGSDHLQRRQRRR